MKPAPISTKILRGPKRELEHNINEMIRAQRVRLVPSGPEDDVQPQVVDTQKALSMAFDRGLDLVEISPNADPPVCRITDYKKFLYEKKKKEKEIKAKSQKTVVKEIRFTANTDDHDIEFKSKHAENFLKEGSKVRAYVTFRGRDIVFKERGELLLLKFAQRLDEFGGVEQLPSLEGKKMFMIIAPKGKGGKKH